MQSYSSFLENFAFLNLSIEDKALISEKTLDDIDSHSLYWVQLLLSTMIATFGLLQNSVAVIIGAMVIAPLLRPIKGIAFGISTGQPSYFWKSTKLQIWSLIISIGAAYIFTWMVPIRIETPEILARTAPNLLDLFIAIASAIIAMLAVYYQKLSESVAGVAMAASLLPPLSVVGIELAFGNLGAAWGSLFLYLTNLFAILSVGVIIFLIYGFSPHQENTSQVTLRSMGILFMLLIFISIPLFSSLTRVADKIQLENTAISVIKSSLLKSIPEAKVEELNVISFSSEIAHFFGTIKIPETQTFFTETKLQMQNELTKKLGRKVELEVEIIPVAELLTEDQKKALEAKPADQIIKQQFQSYLNREFPKATIIDLQVVTVENLDEERQLTTSKWGSKIIYSLPEGEKLDKAEQADIENGMKALFPNDSFSFIWLPIALDSREQAPTIQKEVLTPQQQFHQDLILKWESFFKESLPQNSSIDNFSISWTLLGDEQEEEKEFSSDDILEYFVSFDLNIPSSEESQVAPFKRDARRFAQQTHKRTTDFSIRTFTFDQDDFRATNGLTYKQPE